MEAELGYGPVLALVVLVVSTFRSRSIWTLPVAGFVLLPAIDLSLASVSVGSQDFRFTMYDVSFLACCGALLLRKRPLRLALREMPRELKETALFALALFVILPVANAFGTAVHQPASSQLPGLLRVVRNHCQALVLPLYIVSFLRGRQLSSLHVILSGFAALGVAQGLLEGQLMSGRASPFGMNPNAFGQALALVFVVAVTAYLARWGAQKYRFASIASAGVCALGISISGSREALFAAVAGLLYLIVRVAAWRRSSGRLLGFGFAGGALLVAINLGGRGATSEFETVADRMDFASSERGIMGDDNFETRVRLSLAALSRYVEDPTLPLTGRGIVPSESSLSSIVEDSDSAYFNTLNALGVIGLGAIFWLVFKLWRAAAACRTHSGTGTDVWAFGAQAAVVCYCTMGLAGNVFGSPHTTAVFLTVVCLGCANMFLSGIEERERQDRVFP